MGEREGIASRHERDQALSALLGGVVAVLSVLPQPVPALPAPAAYCNGQTIVTDSGIRYYPNGQRVADGFGKQYYPNGVRIVNDAGDEIRYSNGARVRTMAGDLLFPNGTAVKGPTGDVRYPSGRATHDAGGRCYYETGVEMTPCQRSVSIRQRLGEETIAYELDIAAGTINLRDVRFRFPSDGVITVLSANLVAGEIDPHSIAASCGSSTPVRR